MTQPSIIQKVGGIITKDKRLLVVRKKTADNRSEFIIPGGRKEGDESHQETLTRELMEELGVTLRGMRLFGSFDETAVFENIPLHMDVYYAEVEGEPTPHSEIKEYMWIDRAYADHGIVLGSVLAKHVVPKLVAEGVL
ncbi:MAG: NUDIX domain-containing protein [Patescibacteria group bacterium]|jgi:8-oxo-dGTP pyrophosphatase MutT (NUDIX family)